MSKKFSFKAIAEALKQTGACSQGVHYSLISMNPEQEPLTLEEWWERTPVHDREYAMKVVFGKHKASVCWCQTREVHELMDSPTLPEKVKQAWEAHLAAVTGGDGEVNIHD